ncbi:acetyltransferase (plasmid) [Deinococcus sp. KNUC1210]|uniref:acetyltransferase n=1 Tax=Deinococcus sp. KNUC1210 TaxID=2917691 RepID=UPI001EF060A5|nr:acetyltransferase [Deinococcus sp. KNUC1210]ULH14250.1 acetyltransferase [Deinococcus sp. KNUC1210]
MQPLHILGASGHAKVIVALAHALGHPIAALYDDRIREGDLPAVLGHSVETPVAGLPDTPQTSAVIGIGSNAVRRTLADRFRRVHWEALIHPTAWVAPDAEIGPGSVIMAGAVVQPGARIGAHVIVNTLASVDHDCVLEDYVHVAPGCHLAGNVHLGEGVFAGVGAVFTPGNQVGAWSTIGAGATVISSFPAGITAVGVPARIRTT